MAEPLVLYEVKDQIAFITMNRPNKRNALNTEMSAAMSETWQRFETDPDARVALLRGAGKGFCAGADRNPGADRPLRTDFPVGVFAQPGSRHTYPPSSHSAVPRNGISVFKPIVGAVHGFALGVGLSLAVRGCDITIAAEGTQFGFPEASVGVILTPRAPDSYIPFKACLELYATGTNMTAQRAYEIGMVNRVVPAAELMTEAIRWAEILKKVPAASFRAVKYGYYKDRQGWVRDEWEFENFTRPQVEGKDIWEGRKAFLEKRKPEFTGK